MRRSLELSFESIWSACRGITHHKAVNPGGKPVVARLNGVDWGSVGLYVAGVSQGKHGRVPVVLMFYHISP